MKTPTLETGFPLKTRGLKKTELIKFLQSMRPGESFAISKQEAPMWRQAAWSGAFLKQFVTRSQEDGLIRFHRVEP